MYVCVIVSGYHLDETLSVTMRQTVIADRTELKRGCKCEVLFLCGCQIYALQESSVWRAKYYAETQNLENTWICCDCLQLDGVNQWLT
jgi:hypothetical protein